MFKNYPKSAEQLNDTTLKQMLMVHPVSECHFVIIWTFANSCLCFCVLSEGDIVSAEITDIIDRIIISSFLYGTLNIHLYALYKQTAE